jgi:hypothetical protein
MAGDWRFLAQPLTGTGTEEPPFEVPFLSDVVITTRLAAPPSISARFPVEVLGMKDSSGRPRFQEWGTALYAEDPNEELYGGIIADSSFSGSTWNIDAPGFSYYPKDQPYVLDDWWANVDPLALHAHIWAHLQSLPFGNLGVTLDGTTSPVRIGGETRQAEDGSTVPASFYDDTQEGPYRLAWWQTNDLGKVIDDLAEMTPFDWEEHHWWDGPQIRHGIRRGYPSIGERRTDARFEVGSNVRVVPEVKRAGGRYASNVLVLGAGEGRDRIAGDVAMNTGRPRRVAVVEEKGLTSNADAITRARKESAERQGQLTVATLELTDHPNARIGHVKLGNEYPLVGNAGWVELDQWVRVVGITISPAKSDTIVVDVVSGETGGAQ